MTDSTTDTSSGDGAFDVGSSVDELFGDLETDDWGAGSRTADDEAGEREEPDDVEDQTAAAVFEQLQADTDDEDGADDVLADESPEDIIASADEPDPEPEASIDDDLLADEDELADLLLTGRTKEQEFLWIETEDSSDDDEPSETDAVDDADETTETDGETCADLEPPAEEPGPDESADETEADADEPEDELVERLFGGEGAPGFDPDAGSAADTETESDSPSNSSIAVSTRNGATNSGGETGADDPAAADTNDDGATEDENESDESSGFFRRLLPFVG